MADNRSKLLDYVRENPASTVRDIARGTRISQQIAQRELAALRDDGDLQHGPRRGANVRTYVIVGDDGDDAGKQQADSGAESEKVEQARQDQADLRASRQQGIDNTNFDSMTVGDLRAAAKDRDIEGRGDMNKAELIEALKK